MSEARTPRVIADELKAHAEAANLAFVPSNVTQAIDLLTEFCSVVADAIDAANAAQASATPATPEAGA